MEATRNCWTGKKECSRETGVVKRGNKVNMQIRIPKTIRQINAKTQSQTKSTIKE